MFSLFRVLTDRVKALLFADAAQDLEAQLHSRAAERKAELARQAARYEAEGLPGIAEQLRHQSDGLSVERPLAGILPALTHWEESDLPEAPPPRCLPAPAAISEAPQLFRPKKRGSKS